MIEDGDKISINAETKEITLHVDDALIAQRKANWQRPKPYTERGTLAKFARLAASASEGAVTDKYLEE